MSRADPRRRRNRRAEAGAAVLAAIFVTHLTVIGGVVSAVYVAVGAAQAHAQSGADAVAHAAVVALATDPGRLDFEVDLQAGHPCSFSDGPQPHVPGGIQDGDSAVCRRVIAEAMHVAAANHVVLSIFVIGADPRAMRDGPVATLFATLVAVRVPGPLLHVAAGCDMQFQQPLCWAGEWSAAREAG